MSISIYLTDKGQSAPTSTLKSTLAWLGVASGVAGGATPGTPACVYQFQSPGVIPAQVGYGPGPEGIAAALRVSQQMQVFSRVAGSIAGATGVIAQSGTGPLFTITGAPYDSWTPKLKITKAGPNGTAQFQLALDGGTYGPPVDVPTQSPPATLGSIDLSTWSGGTYTALNTLTILVTMSNGSIKTVTFGATTAINFLTQINAVVGPATVTGTVDLTAFTWTTLGTTTLNFTTGDGTIVPVVFATPANSTAGLLAINTALGAHGTASLVTIGGSVYLRIADAITGVTSLLTVRAGTANAALGFVAGPVVYYGGQATLVSGKYLKIADGVTGQASTLTIGAGTANAALGLVAGAATGANATYQPPNTGMTFTFPVGTWVQDEAYSWLTTEPRFTTADVVAAILAIQTAGVYFRDFVLLNNPIDGADAVTFQTQLGTTLRSMRGTAPRVFALAMMNSSIGIPSAINTNDLDVRTAFNGTSDDYVAVCHGDCYMQGTSQLGTFRRPLVFSLGIRAAAYGISNDPGNRELPKLEETSMLAADLVTYARDEQTALTSMATQRFITAKSDRSAPYFVRGYTRSLTPQFQQFGVMRMAIECSRILFIAAQRYENAKRFLTPAGTLPAPAAAAIRSSIYKQLDEGVGDDISGRLVTIDTTSNVGQTSTLNIQADIQHLGYFYSVIVNAGIVDLLVASPAATG